MAEVNVYFDNPHFQDKDFVGRFGQVVREVCAEALTVQKFPETELDPNGPGNFEVFNHPLTEWDVCDFPIYVSVEFDHHPHRTKQLNDLSVQKMLVEKISHVADCQVGIYFKPVYDGSWIVAMQPLILGEVQPQLAGGPNQQLGSDPPRKRVALVQEDPLTMLKNSQKGRRSELRLD